MDLATWCFILSVFLLAGVAKGVIGLGLPTIAMGLLAIVLRPVEAAALMVLPSLVTNVWQMLDGGRLRALVERLWRLNVGVCVGTWVGAGLLSGTFAGYGTIALGVALMAYALLGLTAVRFAVSPSAERWLGPLAGLATGGITAATGVFVIPAVPYLQAIGLEKDELVQALGLSFTVSTLALAVALVGGGAVDLALAGPSAAAVAVALVGMRIGQAVRSRLRPETFRAWFFSSLLGLGLYLAARALV